MKRHDITFVSVTILTAILLGLRIFGIVDLSVLECFLPMIIGFGAFAISVILFIPFFFSAAMYGKKKKEHSVEEEMERMKKNLEILDAMMKLKKENEDDKEGK